MIAWTVAVVQEIFRTFVLALLRLGLFTCLLLFDAFLRKASMSVWAGFPSGNPRGTEKG